MPELCRFSGIIIRMYFSDHPPPHFHALYAGQVIKIEIGTQRVIAGHLPPRALGLVMEWAAAHRADPRTCMATGLPARPHRPHRAIAIAFAMELAVIIKAEARPGYKIWLRFADGAEGVVDLSDLAGRGVFARWLKPGEFEKVVVDSEWGAVRWPATVSAGDQELDLSPEMLYQRLTGSGMPDTGNEAA